MKRLKLMKLTLNNFKGIEHLELNAEGQDMEIKGSNGTGKTTIFDAFIWLLFSKDSQNKTDFEIKPLNENGEVKQHGLNHEVEGIFLLNDQELSLKRVYTEKWTKKRGSANSVLTGHTTMYYIDGVPSKKKEFDEKINSIVSEDVFRLLTNPLYFNDQLHWTKRREILIELVGTITDAEIAEGDERLERFISELNGKPIEDYLKIIKAKQKEINRELEQIPSRIDENSLSSPDISDLDKDQLEKDLNQIEKEIQSKKDQIAEVKNGFGIQEQKSQLKTLEWSIQNLRNEYENKSFQETSSIQNEMMTVTGKIHELKTRITPNQLEIDFNKNKLDKLEAEIEAKRDEWRTENKKVFDQQDHCVCPTCSQDLPKEKVEEAISNFNKQKAERLEEIQNEAVQKKAEVEKLKQDIEKMNHEIIGWNEELNQLNMDLDQLQDRKGKAEEILDELENDSRYKEFIQQMEDIKNKIANYDQTMEQTISVIENEINSLNHDKIKVQDGLDKIRQANHYQQRKTELIERERELSQEYEKLERSIYLAETFTKRKVEKLEVRINEKFKIARFKMFEEQVNGGINPICDTTYKGIPHNRGLNTAMRINTGIDIINTLQQHYNVYLPLFIDNKESVIDLIPTESQVISLIVAETDSLNIKKLA